MARNPQKRQKQLAKKKAKRKTVAKKMIEKIGGVFSQTAPIHECLIASQLFEAGIGTVIIARKMPNGEIRAGFFMLDVFCLGVKSAFFTILTQQEYQLNIMELKQRENMQNISPACARKVIEDCAAYANNLGLSPDPDYKKAKNVFGNINTDECSEEFEFGKDGKPLYVTGPFDTPEKSEKIINKLNKSCGADNFHYILNIDSFKDDEEKEETEFRA